MAVSKKDREKFQRQAADLAEIETDDFGTREQRRRLIDFVNFLRARRGERPLPYDDDDEEDEFPELGFFQRAEALGMARIRHRRA